MAHGYRDPKSDSRMHRQTACAICAANNSCHSDSSAVASGYFSNPQRFTVSLAKSVCDSTVCAGSSGEKGCSSCVETQKPGCSGCSTGMAWLDIQKACTNASV